MKKTLITLLFSCLSLAIFANSVCIDGLYYVLDKDNLTAKVTYKSQKGYSYNEGWDISEAVIPETVTYKKKTYRITLIGGNAFAYCKNLTSVSIPNSVNRIGRYAFYGCENLRSVSIPNSVTSIGAYAISNCKSLTSVSIPNSVTSIEEGAFRCSGLTSITIPHSVTKLGKSVFNGCSNLSSVTLPKGISLIDEYTFYGCSNLTSISIPNSVTSLGKSAFANCSNLTSIALPKGIKRIDEYTFSGCSSLSSILISDSVTAIWSHAFEKCPNLKSVAIPKSVNWLFQDCFEKNTELFIPKSHSIDVLKLMRSGLNYTYIPDNQLEFYNPFSAYAKEYVTKGINLWRQKGEFERTSEWQKRVTPETQEQKIKSLLAEAEDKYINFHVDKAPLRLTLGEYDADNEVFSVSDPQYGAAYLAVPYAEAKDFKAKWDQKTTQYKMRVLDDKIKLTYLSVQLPNGKTYAYRNTDAVNYNLSEVEYDFDVIELDKLYASSQQGQQNISSTKLKVGKSKVDTDIPTTGASNPNTFVIIFANEDYKNVASVPFAKNDGSVFQKYCQRTLGIPVTNIHYVENASFNDMRIQLAWLKDICDAFEGQASLIIYYAGHGIPDESDKSAYLLPVDGDSRYVQSAYKLDDFYQKLGSMNAKAVTVFMDACFSGSKREAGMLASARGVALKAKSGVPQGNMVVFSAAQGDETAYPNREQQHGLFTYYLLKKLQETQGDIALKDLGEYIIKQVSQQSLLINEKKQTPCVTPSASLGSEWQNWKLK